MRLEAQKNFGSENSLFNPNCEEIRQAVKQRFSVDCLLVWFFSQSSKSMYSHFVIYSCFVLYFLKHDDFLVKGHVSRGFY